MASDRICAYCGADGNLTREHILPSFTYSRERGRTGAPVISNVLHDGKNKVVPAEVTISDVCATCNNGILSKLDQYGSELYDKYFFKIVHPGELIQFEYEFERLTRWLLKIAFNACRSRSWPDSFRQHLDGIKSYIRDGGVPPPGLRLYLQLIVPAVLTPLQKSQNWEENGIAIETLEPAIRRIAPFYAKGITAGLLLGMNSYQFHMMAWDSDLTVKQIKNIEEKFLRETFGAKRLKENELKSAIYPSEVDLFKIAEGNRFLRENAALGAEWVKNRTLKRR